MNGLKFVILLLLSCTTAFARGNAWGWCENGGQVVYTNSFPSSTTVQQSYPACTVTVYLAGTSTKATIYEDNMGTPLLNPFTATTGPTAPTGFWNFYADNASYSVQLSGTGISAPFSVGPFSVIDPSATGSVSITPGCNLSSTPNPLTGTGSIIESPLVVNVNGNYTIASSNCGNVLTTNVTSTFTLPRAGTTGFPAGWFVILQNVSAAGTLSVPTTISFYYGAGASGSNLLIGPGIAAKITSDQFGNYEVLGLGVPPNGTIASISGALPIVVTPGPNPTVSVNNAATGTVGVVQPDNTTTFVNGAGVLSALTGGTTNQNYRGIGSTFVITGTTQTDCQEITSGGIILQADTVADVVGSVAVAIATTTFSFYDMQGGIAAFNTYTSITGTAPPSLNGTAPTRNLGGGALTGWSLILTQGQIMCIQISSPVSVGNVKVKLTYAAN